MLRTQLKAAPHKWKVRSLLAPAGTTFIGEGFVRLGRPDVAATIWDAIEAKRG
jgi:hypothetical protein